MIRCLISASAAALVMWAAASAQAPTAAGVVVGVGNFSHIVESLDRSVQFYRDVIGLEGPGAARLFSGDLPMKVGNTPGAESVFTALTVPGSPLGVEIIEYRKIDRRPARPRFQDPGAANLILTVRDIDAIVARVKKSGTQINSASGVPATIQGGSRVMFVQDPDGFFIELFQPRTIPDSAAAVSSNVINSGFEIMVADTEPTLRLYRDVLGFHLQAGTTFDSNKLLMETAGTPGAEFKRTAGRIPGSPVTMALLEFKNIDRRPLRTRFQDPGTPVLQLRVKDIQTVTQAWKNAGGEVITAGGEPVNLGNLTLVVLRDPNNVMLELIAMP